MQQSLLLYNFQCQSKLSVHAHLDGYVKALFSMWPDTPPSRVALSICAFAFRFLTGGGNKPYFAQGRAQRRRWEV